MSLHYLGKLKIQFFCRYSADTEENGQDFDKKFVFEGVHSIEVDRQIYSEKLDKVWC